jgi:dual specificity phosphatase 12
VEDAVNGLLAAAAAGCYAVGVTNSLCASLLAPHARLVVGSLLDIDLAAPPSGLQVEVE